MLKEFGFLPTLPSLLATPHKPIIHRDLSWLQFNERVMNEARDSTNPLLERVKFLAISASNLDEFFMIRFASLTRSITTYAKTDPAIAERRQEIRDNILETVAEFIGRQADTLESLATALESYGIVIVRNALPGDPGFEVGKAVFEAEVLAHIAAPEPFLAASLTNLDNLQSGVVFQNHRWSQIPKNVPGVMVRATETGVFAFFLDDLIMTHVGAFAPAPLGVVRLTRDGDFSIDLDLEDPESIPDVVRTGLGTRDKGRPVRLQYFGQFAEVFLAQAMQSLKLLQGQLVFAPVSLYMPSLWTLVKEFPTAVLEAHPGLQHPAFATRVPRIFERKELILEHLKVEDILLHHPYDSFDAYVRFIEAACDDPNVISIEQTVYRMDALSPVMEALKRAAGTKKVRVVIELRARFDELNNLRLAEELKKAGAEVAYGFGKLKLHAKIALVTREEPDGQTIRYTHLSTGNYNSATARLYTDLAILTSKPEVGQDARIFFDAVVKEEIPTGFKHLVAAPTKLHRRLLSHIEAEADAARAGGKARIVAKVNALVDEEVIEKLYAASQAGVQIDLIVRGACSLVPGIQGLSENIRVISVVDRLLEHSRIYYFGHSKALYLSSADWMPRNFFSRLELAFAVNDPLLFRYIEEILIPIYLADAVKGRELTALGTWKKRTLGAARAHISGALKQILKGETLRSQFLFEKLAHSEYAGTPLAERLFVIPPTTD